MKARKNINNKNMSNKNMNNKDNVTKNEELNERLALVSERIRMIISDNTDAEDGAEKRGMLADERYSYLDFFIIKSKYISAMLDICEKIHGSFEDKITKSDDDAEEKAGKITEDTAGSESVTDIPSDIYSQAANYYMYKDVIGENYETSYSNPDYAEEKLGIFGSVLSFISAELQALPAYIFDKKFEDILYLLELFVQLYCMFESGDTSLSSVEEAVYYYGFDYVDHIVAERMTDTFTPKSSVAYDIVMNEDLSSTDYLYRYGEYISDTERKLSEYLASLSENRITEAMKVYTDGFRRGFDVMGVDFTGKKSVWIRYHIGQERMIRKAIELFSEMGLDVILARCAQSRLVKRGVVKQGYESTPANRQFEYDHRNDERFFLDSRLVDRRVKAAAKSYEVLGEKIKEFAGPAVIETFGEDLFSPERKESMVQLTEEQQELSRTMFGKLGEVSNRYLP